MNLTLAEKIELYLYRLTHVQGGGAVLIEFNDLQGVAEDLAKLSVDST